MRKENDQPQFEFSDGFKVLAPSRTGNFLYELVTADGKHVSSYEEAEELAEDYVYGWTSLSVDQAMRQARFSGQPHKYRVIYDRLFLSVMRGERVTVFMDSLQMSLRYLQEKERWCRENSKWFSFQGTGIHLFNQHERKYEFWVGGPSSIASLGELENEVRRSLLDTPSGNIGGFVADQEATVYDAFISHASEDKDVLVRSLAQALQERGCRVWYDEFELKVGDSLRQSIDRGLAQSRYGIVVLSKAFFSKRWPAYELNGLLAREIDGVKVILPIWHDIEKADLLRHSPSLADKLALKSTSSNVHELADELAEVVRRKPNQTL